MSTPKPIDDLTAAGLRGLTSTAGVLACSPVRLVGPDGAELIVAATQLTGESAPDENGVPRPASVPVLTIHLAARGAA